VNVVDVILTGGTEPITAARQATSTIPIVMAQVGDPVAAGFVASLARPGGNVTGLSLLATELSAKRLALLKETLPGVKRLAMIWNPDNASVVLKSKEIEAAARADLNQATNAPDALSDRTHWMEVLDEARQPLLSALAGLAGYLGRWRRVFVVQVKARDDL
jgi:ABC-type uncharacterized transport system substrate-binding protein